MVDTHKKAVYLKLSNSQWRPTMEDKSESQKQTEEKNAEDGMIRFRKTIMKDTGLAAIGKVYNKFKGWAEKNSWPWADRGIRIMPVTVISKFLSKRQKAEDKFKDKKEIWCRDYRDQLVFAHAGQWDLAPMFKAAKEALGGLPGEGGVFSLDDYPPDIEERFKFTAETRPIPLSADFRLSIADDEVAQMKRDYEVQMKRDMEKAMKEPKARLLKALKGMHEVLTDDDTGFNVRRLTGLKDLCEQLPKLDIWEDEDLKEVCTRVIDELCTLDAKEIRDDEETKDYATDVAEEIIERLDGYFV